VEARTRNTEGCPTYTRTQWCDQLGPKRTQSCGGSNLDATRRKRAQTTWVVFYTAIQLFQEHVRAGFWLVRAKTAITRSDAQSVRYVSPIARVYAVIARRTHVL